MDEEFPVKLDDYDVQFVNMYEQLIDIQFDNTKKIVTQIIIYYPKIKKILNEVDVLLNVLNNIINEYIADKIIVNIDFKNYCTSEFYSNTYAVRTNISLFGYIHYEIISVKYYAIFNRKIEDCNKITITYYNTENLSFISNKNIPYTCPNKYNDELQFIEYIINTRYLNITHECRNNVLMYQYDKKTNEYICSYHKVYTIIIRKIINMNHLLISSYIMHEINRQIEKTFKSISV